MYCGTDRHGWDMFWAKRGNSPTPISDLTPFYNNFTCMMGILGQFLKCRPNSRAGTMSTLEVGAGRGTISELFKQKGFNTFCTDIENRIAYPRYDFPFVENDILESQPFAPDQFDITFTYGLLEHFKLSDRNIIMERCLAMTRPGGIVMHYVVPKKIINYNEDKSVYRDRCKDLMCNPDEGFKYRNGGIKYVYPVIDCGRDWECRKFLSKGFIWWIQKWKSLDKLISDGVIRDIERQLNKRNVLLEKITE